MLTAEENETLTRTGADTPMGRMMRRFWLPVCSAHQVAEPDATLLVHSNAIEELKQQNIVLLASLDTFQKRMADISVPSAQDDVRLAALEQRNLDDVSTQSFKDAIAAIEARIASNQHGTANASFGSAVLLCEQRILGRVGSLG